MQIKRVGFISLKANIINIKRKEEYLNGSKINMTIQEKWPNKIIQSTKVVLMKMDYSPDKEF